MLQTLRLALSALTIAAAACGGSDPPGGGNGNGDTDGGGNGTTDGHVPDPSNPLIEIIPGHWEFYERDGQKPDNRNSSSVSVRPDDPDCGQRCLSPISSTPCPVGPPGDACISPWPTYGYSCRYLILEENAVRARDYDYGSSNCDILGEVLDGGTRVVFTITTTGVEFALRDGENIACVNDADCPTGAGTCQSGYCGERFGPETHVDAFRKQNF